MELELTKFQRQGLGNALKAAGYAPGDFLLTKEVLLDNKKGSKLLTNRATLDNFQISDYAGNYNVKWTVPGTSKFKNRSNILWDDVLIYLQNWAREVKLESEAIDPWEKDAEQMSEDDSYFSIQELPKVDYAIDESLKVL